MEKVLFGDLPTNFQIGLVVMLIVIAFASMASKTWASNTKRWRIIRKTTGLISLLSLANVVLRYLIDINTDLIILSTIKTSFFSFDISLTMIIYIVSSLIVFTIIDK